MFAFLFLETSTFSISPPAAALLCPFHCHQLDTTLALESTSGLVGRSCASVATAPILLTTSIPAQTRPKIVCLPSRNGAGASVMKNWDPLVLGPELAIASTPAPVW